MVCLTSCVFRSIRFSGFARPHRLGYGARENYTRRRRREASVGASVHETHTNWGIIVVLGALPRSRKAGPGPQSPRPAPTGRASAPLDARRPSGRRPRNARPRQAPLQRPSPIKDARFPTPPPPQMCERQARPADGRTFPARAATPPGAQIGPSSPCAGCDAARRSGRQS